MTGSQRCRSCGAPIRWVKTQSELGKHMPVDDERWWLLPGAFKGDGDVVGVDDQGVTRRGYRVAAKTFCAFEVGTSHFATCPNADAHRKR